MFEPNLAVMAVSYLLPICYGIGVVRGYQRATGAEVNMLGILWLIFWPAALVAMAWIEIRNAVKP